MLKENFYLTAWFWTWIGLTSTLNSMQYHKVMEVTLNTILRLPSVSLMLSENKKGILTILATQEKVGLDFTNITQIWHENSEKLKHLKQKAILPKEKEWKNTGNLLEKLIPEAYKPFIITVKNKHYIVVETSIAGITKSLSITDVAISNSTHIRRLCCTIHISSDKNKNGIVLSRQGNEDQFIKANFNETTLEKLKEIQKSLKKKQGNQTKEKLSSYRHQFYEISFPGAGEICACLKDIKYIEEKRWLNEAIFLFFFFCLTFLSQQHYSAISGYF